LGSLHEIWERHGARVAFLVVYIREAHPEDGWVVTMNRDAGIAFEDPTNDDERLEAAASCAIGLKIRMPVVVDAMDDRIARAYGALPDRLYLIGRRGRVAFQGAPGPFGFKPEELEAAIQAELDGGASA
jgi:hypothetical protein